MEALREYSIELAGRTLTFGVGDIAGQANGACTVRYGDTLVLATATMGGERDTDYFPLMVDYEERMYAAGRIKGSRFIKREGRPTDEAILSGRLIDRAIRPLFDDSIHRDVQVVATVFSHDQENDADIPGLIGASCALMLSDIPWQGPIAAVRIGRKDGQFIVMPTYEQVATGDLDLVVAGTPEKTVMVEAGANILPEDLMLEAMQLAANHLGPVIDLINAIVREHGKEKWDPEQDPVSRAAREEKRTFKEKVYAILRELSRTHMWEKPLTSKQMRKEARAGIERDLDARLIADGASPADIEHAKSYLYDFMNAEASRMILEEGRRIDGRGLYDIRPLSSEVDVLPRTHGSGLFKRGETHVLSAITLGSPGMQQTLDTMEFQMQKRYFHHYNFPPYSVGEAKSNRGPGRREIGHGALAERALQPVLPPKEEFPYTMRVVSEVLSSNGSSSMASTCGSTLALMDGGVPLKAPVAGVAMGLASDEKNGRYQVISDLQDLEDGRGGMDFKITGTKDGITAIQMDTKTSGLPWKVVEETIHRAKEARLQVLDNMLATIGAPRAELSKWAPRIESFFINPEKIRDVIGPGGKMINEIIAQTNVQIDIEDSGLVMVTAANPEGMRKAVDWIKQLTREVKVGEIFDGPVTRILDFGAFVEILPKQEGLVHVSEMADYHVNSPKDIVKIGDMVKVKVYEIDSMGRINLSMKRALPGYKDEPGAERPRRDHGRGPRRDHGGRRQRF
jgi:polyribonucleotide nucleotidyltransferase